MQSLIEILEARQMLSATVHSAQATHAEPKHPPIHVPAKATAPVNFAGEAVDSTGEATELLMTVTRAGSGFNVRVTVMNGDGIAGTLTMKANANGLITFQGKAGKDTLSVQAQLTSNGIGGTFSSLGKDGTTTTGTLSLSRIIGAETHFVGTALDSRGETSRMYLTVETTVSGYVALARVVNPNNSNNGNSHEGGVVLMADSTSHFVYNGPNDTEQLHAEAQLSADGKTLTGHWTSVKDDGSTGNGTFSDILVG